jgi:phosphatidate phosphatase APP1
MSNKAAVKIYHGFGHTHNLIVFGHVFKKKPHVHFNHRDNLFSNIIHLVRLFIVKPLPGVTVRLILEKDPVTGKTEDDGFFKFEWAATQEIEAGWHDVEVHSFNDHGEVNAKGEGKVFIPHSTQYGFISDIDDTIMISHSATVRRRLRELFIKNPKTRKTFPSVGKHYSLLAATHTTAEAPNPFFYVSSSEWNLYDYLREFFEHNRLPEGAFLLNQVKRWFELWRTGKTKHQGKLLRIIRILEAFPKQQFILFGDNTQSDPLIYAAITEKFPGKIMAVYIRNIVPKHATITREVLEQIEKRNVHTCLFADSEEAIAHSRKIGLIE